MATASNIIADAMKELGALAIGETPSAEDSADGLTRLNRMLDTWNTERLTIYQIRSNIYLLPANMQHPTIGVSGTFIAFRPERFEAANTISLASTAVTGTTATTGAGDSILTDATHNFTTDGVIAGRDLVYVISGTAVTAGIYEIATVGTTTLTLTTNPGSSGSAISYRVILNPFRYPMDVHGTPQWWASVQNRGYASIPVESYYEPSWPNGTLHLYPYSSTVLGLELFTWQPFTAFSSILQAVSFPPGYEEALMYNLAVRLAPSFSKPIDPVTASFAISSKAKIKSINAPIPYIPTRDYGMPGNTPIDYWHDPLNRC